MNRQDDMKEERKIEIVKAAAEHGNETGQFCDLVHSPLSNGVDSGYGIGFIEGAVWADRTMIENVCNWIIKNFPSSNTITSVMYADDFRKDMGW